ncbi:hypothetical protein ROHU_031204 [Labeo rohita]|uniref:Uncharacterized protein n=1 Tax=Labeo rohita TaxID=84645 RepID=A0A498LSU2_LABRO|nr:hypothetical protein ROHU_031204 [Labeo rohita]
MSDCERKPLDSFGTKTQFIGAEWTLGYGVFPIANKGSKELELKAHGSVTALMSTLICRISRRRPIGNTGKGLDNAEIVCIRDKHETNKSPDICIRISGTTKIHFHDLSSEKKPRECWLFCSVRSLRAQRGLNAEQYGPSRPRWPSVRERSKLLLVRLSDMPT